MEFTLSVELQEIIEKRYETGKILNFNRLEGGWWNDVFAIRTERQHYVLRISHPTTKLESLKYEHILMKFMNNHIREVMVPLVQNDGKTFLFYEGRIISLFPFMKGSVVSKINNAKRIAAAKMLSQLHLAALDFPGKQIYPGQHKSLAELDWDNNHLWNWKQLKHNLEKNSEIFTSSNGFNQKQLDCILELVVRRDEIELHKSALSNWVKDLVTSKSELLSAPTHGDYYRGNLLFMEENISAVIDWDECRPDWLAYELARATWEFCKDKGNDTLNQKYALEFVQEYRNSGGPVSLYELKLLIPFICCVRIIEILFYLEQASQGEEWDPEYTLHNLNSLKNLYNTKDLF